MITDIVSKNPLVERIVNDDISEEIQDLLFKKELPLTEEEYLECLIFTLKREDLKAKAIDQLNSIPEHTKANYIEKKEANHRVAYFILSEALKEKKIDIVSKCIRNPFLPIEFMQKIAKDGTPAMLETLLDNQIKMIAFPEIMEAMETNPEITKFVLGKIGEIREFYLRKEISEEIPEQEIIDELDEIFSMDQEKELVEENEDISKEEFKIKTISSLQKINVMTIAERIRLAFVGSKTDRLILIRDPNRIVAQSVLESPKLGRDEIFYYVKNKSTPGYIISKIANNRGWTTDYPLVLELSRSPKTPMKTALRFRKKLFIKDLRQITVDKNIHPTVRKLAMSMYREKTVGKGK